MVTCNAFLGGTKNISKTKLRFRPAVYALIPQDDQVLLVSMRRTKKYYLPGGGIDLGEKIEDALKREVREETGIKVEVGQFVHFQEDFFYYDPSDEAYHSMLFYYLCRPITFELADEAHIDDGEVEKPDWVDWKNLRSEDFHDHGNTILGILRSM
jgi:8-oxo-dGTP pyrophosphatase MutT (NUDIX family)